MKSGVRIIQISDCHLSAMTDQRYRGIDPYKNLQGLIHIVRTRQPDLLLASGDLSEDGSLVSYQRLHALFTSLGVPVLVLPGNHDDADLLARVFPGSPSGAVALSDHDAWQIIRLNSCIPGKPEGRIAKKDLDELDDILLDGGQRPRLIALHHQPISIGSPWIDRYPLLEPENFLKIIDRHPHVKAIVWGHVHLAFGTRRKGTLMLGGPSSAINSLAGVRKFTPDPAGPACRWLELKADGTLATGIIQFDSGSSNQSIM